MNLGTEGVNNCLRIPGPRLECGLAALSSESVSFDSIDTVVISGYQQLPGMYVVGKPYFVLRNEPIWMMRFE